jgi:hypothetical protein
MAGFLKIRDHAIKGKYRWYQRSRVWCPDGLVPQWERVPIQGSKIPLLANYKGDVTMMRSDLWQLHVREQNMSIDELDNG